MSGARADAAVALRYARGLRGFLRTPLTSAAAAAIFRERLARREHAFLAVLERAVYAHETSPYRALLVRAGVELGDVAKLVDEHGVEGALDRLHDAGVHVTLDEFKGRRPIVRDGLELAVSPEDFDNPVVDATLVGSTGASRGAGRRVLTDFEHRTDQAVGHRLLLDVFGLGGRPVAIWRSAPPGTGLSGVLGLVKAGAPVERWFSLNRIRLQPSTAKDVTLAAYTILAARLAGVAFPRPEHVPMADPRRIVDWLASRRRAGTPGVLAAAPSSAVRVCLAAERAGVDVSGSFFRLGGEPYTDGKAAVLARVGAAAASNYGMAECGRIGIGCATPTAVDDHHVLTSDVAVVQRHRDVGNDGAGVDALLLTTLRPNAPKLMLNVESDDYATLEQRECGCPLGALGFTWHLRGIRSHEKLTSEGMTFLGSDLVAALERILPERFGGSATDYQLVERERDGLQTVTLVIDPAVGGVDERAAVETLLAGLGDGAPWRRTMAEVWRSGDTVRVERRAPYLTGGGKIQPLHVE
jgi:HAMP domain-containing protein